MAEVVQLQKEETFSSPVKAEQDFSTIPTWGTSDTSGHLEATVTSFFRDAEQQPVNSLDSSPLTFTSPSIKDSYLKLPRENIKKKQISSEQSQINAKKKLLLAEQASNILVHPVIDAMGKEEEELNVLLPQTGLPYYEIGVATVMYTELASRKVSWKNFWKSIPKDKIPNPYIIKWYNIMHEVNELPIRLITPDMLKGSVFTYPDDVAISWYIERSLLPFLEFYPYSSELLTHETYADKGAPNISVVNLDMLEKVEGTEAYNKFIGLMQAIRTYLHGEQLKKKGMIIRASLGNKKLQDNNFRERLLSVVKQKSTVEAALRQEGPHPSNLNNASLEDIFAYYDEQDLFKNRFAFSNGVIKSSFQFLAQILTQKAQQSHIPEEAALSIFNIGKKADVNYPIHEEPRLPLY